MDNFSNKEMMQDTNQDDHKNFDEHFVTVFFWARNYVIN
jgi:hypothetical protein